jgi:hypothetical protein
MRKEHDMKAAIALTAVAIGIIVATYGIITTLTVEVVIQRQWKQITAADDDPGAGNSGVLNIFIYPHSADPGTDYATNITEEDAYAHGHLNSTATGNVPYDTTFDIVVKVRFNDTVAYNTTGTTWEMDWVRGNITCADLSIGADSAMTEVQIATNDDYMWVHYYINNADSGYTISHGESVNITSLTFDGYY